MKKYVRGKYYKLTQEEIEEMKNAEKAASEPTILERLEAIEELLLEGVLSGD